MAVLTMAFNNNNNNSSSSANNNKNTNNEAKLTFHDFLGMSCAPDSPLLVAPKTSGFVGDIRPSEPSASASASVGASSSAHGPVSAATSDLGSERQAGNQFEGVSFHGSRSDLSGPEISNRFPGRKRINSESTFMGSTRDGMPQTGPGSLENSHLMKILRNGGGGERPRWSQDEELFFGMQPPRPTSTSIILQPPIGSGRPDSVISKWERPMHMNAGSMMPMKTPLLNQTTPFADKVSSTKYREANTGPWRISQPAADEGSRTGIKGSGILSVINASGGPSERNSPGVMPSGSRPTSGPHIGDPESSNTMSRHGLMSASRQMTIFYAGQAHVFDDVHPNKAEVIMALAGSNGASWSTSYSPKSSAQPPHGENFPSGGGNEMGKSSLPFSQDIRGRLSISGNPCHGLTSQGGRVSTTRSDSLDLPSGVQQSGVVARDTRSLARASETDTRSRREV
ncbi:protein TIFY 8 isoform X2 [Telopea speciosissima]|uniref:protein TIFY 8 isoform X2 n=1 Tax=Telopea speciosissima TaxID=54955 RepID=UPI001CC6C93C|nr:protein TIFY 8 isoform X2 [Telopea speciosissima]